MNIKPKRMYEARANIAKALANPNRLLILDALKDGDLCVCELTKLVGADQSTVSKHLSLLHNAGLVEHRKDGTMVYYSLKCKCLDGFFGCIETILQKNLELQREMIIM